jgi:hypothetical protein
MVSQKQGQGHGVLAAGQKGLSLSRRDVAACGEPAERVNDAPAAEQIYNQFALLRVAGVHAASRVNCNAVCREKFLAVYDA